MAIVSGHLQSGFKTDVLRGRGWHLGWPLRGLGQTAPDPRAIQDYNTVIYSGLVNLPGGGTAQASLTNGDLYGGWALLRGVSRAQAEADCGAGNGGVPVGNVHGAGGCSGVLDNILQYIQSGYLAFDPSTRQWARSPVVTPPSGAAAAAYAAAAAASPFTNPRGSQVSPVYTQNQNAAALIAAYNQANPQAVQATPATATSTAAQQQPSTSVQATTGAATTTTLVAGATPTSTGNFLTDSMIAGIPNWVLLGGGAAVLLVLFQHHGR